MSIYSGYPRRHSKLLTGEDMKVINKILTDSKIKNLEFNSPEEFQKAIDNSSYPEVTCTDESRVEIFYDVIKNNPRVSISIGTIKTMDLIKKRLQIFGKLGT